MDNSSRYTKTLYFMILHYVGNHILKMCGLMIFGSTSFRIGLRASSQPMDNDVRGHKILFLLTSRHIIYQKTFLQNCKNPFALCKRFEKRNNLRHYHQVQRR